METMKCYYDVTDKVNEIARQHAEKTAPVFRGWRHSYEVTMDTLIAGLSYFDKNGRFGDMTPNGITRYFRCYKCKERLDDVSGDLYKWFNTKDEMRGALTSLTEEYTARYGTPVVAVLTQQQNYCSKIAFYGVNEFGRALSLNDDGRPHENDKITIDVENPVTTDNDGKHTLYLNPADIADELWPEVQRLVKTYKKTIKDAFDARRKELGAGDNLLAAIQKAQMKNK